jgi:hypothetical protein
MATAAVLTLRARVFAGARARLRVSAARPNGGRRPKRRRIARSSGQRLAVAGVHARGLHLLPPAGAPSPLAGGITSCDGHLFPSGGHRASGRASIEAPLEIITRSVGWRRAKGRGEDLPAPVCALCAPRDATSQARTRARPRSFAPSGLLLCAREGGARLAS